MSNLIASGSASKLAGFLPRGQRIIFAQRVSLGAPPFAWVFLVIGIALIAFSTLAVFGAVNLMPNTSWGRSDLSALIFFVLWTSLAAWGIFRKKEGDVAITSDKSVLSLLPHFRSGHLRTIELKEQSILVIQWKADRPTPFHFSYSGEPIKIESEDAQIFATQLSDLTGVPITSFNGFASKTMYNPKET